MGPVTERQEVLLSYFTGLAPVGEAVCVSWQQACADLGWNHKPHYYNHLKRLIEVGCVERVERGMYRVVRRLEAA